MLIYKYIQLFDIFYDEVGRQNLADAKVIRIPSELFVDYLSI